MSSSPTTSTQRSVAIGIRHGWRPRTMTSATITALDQPHEHERAERAGAGQLADAHAEPADRQARRASAHSMPDGVDASWPGARVTRTTATSARPMPTTTSVRRHALEQEADRDRDHGGEDAGGRGDDAHPPDGEPAVERRDPDHAEDAAGDRPGDVRALRQRLAPEHGEHERREHADELGPEHDPEQRRAAAEQPAAEVARPPGGRRDEAERRGPRSVPRAQAGATPSGSTWASAAVGPSSATTLSASAS